MAFGCRFCAIEKGITVRDCFENQEDFFNHLEVVHDLVVSRVGESDEQARERVKTKNPRLGTKNCQCPGCKQGRRRNEQRTLGSHGLL